MTNSRTLSPSTSHTPPTKKNKKKTKLPAPPRLPHKPPQTPTNPHKPPQTPTPPRAWAWARGASSWAPRRWAAWGSWRRSSRPTPPPATVGPHRSSSGGGGFSCDSGKRKPRKRRRNLGYVGKTRDKEEGKHGDVRLERRRC